jgi:hypothetical protein
LRQEVQIDKTGRPEFSKKASFKIYHNKLYLLCATYPEYLVFPAQADDDCIVASGKFRSANRLPALTFYDKVTGTSIWRCAQPGSGLFNKLSKDDVNLLRYIGMCNGNPRNIHHTVLIHDSRPKLNA